MLRADVLSSRIRLSFFHLMTRSVATALQFLHTHPYTCIDGWWSSFRFRTCLGKCCSVLDQPPVPWLPPPGLRFQLTSTSNLRSYSTAGVSTAAECIAAVLKSRLLLHMSWWHGHLRPSVGFDFDTAHGVCTSPIHPMTFDGGRMPRRLSFPVSCLPWLFQS